MNELEVLDRTLRAIFERHAGRDARTEVGDAFPQRLWEVLDESGMTTIGSLEAETTEAELMVLARATGRAAAAVPVVEMAGLASWLVTYAGLAMPAGIGTVASGHADDHLSVASAGDGWKVTGRLHRVPWARNASWLAAVADVDGLDHVLVLPVGEVVPGRNLAGEPRDMVEVDVVVPGAAVARSAVGHVELRRRGAALRAAQMAGAMESIRDLSIGYATEREQFGSPIASFQAIQHHLVAVAEEALCTSMAVELVVAAGESERELAVAAAKVTAGRAAAVVARRAHQVHAAIGVTAEHALPWFTTRLWSWQDEFGPAAEWSRLLGRFVLSSSPGEVWPLLSATVGASELTDAPAAEREEVPA